MLSSILLGLERRRSYDDCNISILALVRFQLQEIYKLFMEVLNFLKKKSIAIEYVLSCSFLTLQDKMGKMDKNVSN